MTGWASDTAISGFPLTPYFNGPSTQHIDYIAPAYFHQFADFLAAEDSAAYNWNIYKFRRATASSDWLMGQLLDNSLHIPFAGNVDISDSNEATITNFNEGEDFRLGWRTILNRIWNGNPGYSWNPETHQIQPGVSNTYESDIGNRFARFLWDTRQVPWNNDCMT